MKCLKFFAIVMLILSFAAGTTEVMKEGKLCFKGYGITNCTKDTCHKGCSKVFGQRVGSLCYGSTICICFIPC
ncbi:hypothetical protein SLEP1_g30770 [Rubroshorea leprosula]|uniref:Uncharacterized protein n=1 Tax=Rubroshorea leprosula TaxID=152421 RepID=A0AAV5K6N2_9ROSI|nr:hypothetical protein SLEP1_g30770 [Rubroshorea leprosula]